MSRLQLLDSSRHKLRLARYHAEALLAILAQEPRDDPDHALRVPLEAHLEGLAYTGTAAAEKTIRSLGPDRIPERSSISQMILAARACESEPEQALARDFETWWTGRERGTRYAEVARDLRNDAAHDVYDKMRNGRRWTFRMDRRHPILIDEFAQQYLQELAELEVLVTRAEDLAALGTTS